MEFELMKYIHVFYKWIDGVLIFLFCFSEWFTTLVSQSSDLHHLNVNVCKFMFKISVIPDFVTSRSYILVLYSECFVYKQLCER